MDIDELECEYFRVNKYVHYFADAHAVIITNLATGSILVAKENVIKLLQLFEEPSFHKSKLSKLDRSLIEHDIFIDVKRNEYEEYENFLRKRNCDRIKNKTANYSIYVTDFCNFMCSYCYVQKGRHGDISEYALDRIIANVSNAIRTKQVSINWVGGEPILALEKIERFYDALLDKRAPKKGGFSISSSITTNGFLLSLDIMERLLKCKVDKFQVTFDGNKSRHNSYRATCSCRDTYTIIMENLVRLSETKHMFHMNVRCNFAPHDKVEDVCGFVDDYLAKLGSDARFSISMKPIIEYNKWTIDRRSCYSGVMRYRIDLANRYKMFEKDLFDCLSPKSVWCNANYRDSKVISPSGDEYYCNAVINQQKYKVNLVDRDNSTFFNTISHNSLCNSKLCDKYPICLNGCKLANFEGVRACVGDSDDIREVLKHLLNRSK